jgi:PKD repeat protein
VTVTWEVPDNGGTPLTGYKVYRGTASGGETLLATIGPGKPAYLDATADPNTQYFYRVSAVNAQGEGPFCGEVSVVAGNVQSRCVLPGITVITDPTGDQTGAPANTELDIQSVSLAEPWLNSCSDQLVFTLKVADLSVVPPQAQWTIFFSRANGTEYFVAMVSNGTGNPTGVQFDYGHTSTGTGGVRQLTTDGTADAGSGFTADGTITIVLSLAKLTFNLNPPPATLPPPAPGDTFGNINALTQQTVGVLLVTMDSTASAGYTLAGNKACEPSVPPIAQLTATPTGGPAPLSVMFDGSGSSEPDLCDTITSYTFDFGDGSPPVTQATATNAHNYVVDGEFPARLKVTDSRATASANTAQQLITVEGGTPLCGSGGGLCYFTVTPCRTFDSRSGSPLASGTQFAVQIGGTCGVPMSARAVSVNLTVVGPTGNGFLSVYPDATGAPPTTSTLNFVSGLTRANNVVSGLAAGGQGTFIVLPDVGGGGTVNVVVDVNGYFQ